MIKKLALVTAIALLAALPLPMWNATRNLVTRPSVPAVVWIAVGIAYLFSAILPLFYFAMWRNAGEVHFSKRLRWFCLAGVLSGLFVIREQMPVETLTTALSMLATLSCMVLLAAMFLRPGRIGHKSAFLRRMTWIAVIGGVLWLGVNVLALFSNPAPGALSTVFEQVCLFTVPLLMAFSRAFR